MPFVVGIAFKPVTKVYYFDPAGIEGLTKDERVIVETSRGRTVGSVVTPPREVSPSEITGTLKPVVRRATAWDLVQQDQMEHRGAEALPLCRERAKAAGLDMKVVQVEFAFDESSAVVYFTSDGRIDFRNLVHDLGQALHTRVEMRQVGVRDHAKLVGGCGKCGRPLCCATWLREFIPVSIKMAKQQDLPLNTSEVSGLCGRLLCCLSYQNDYYVEARKQMPKVNSMVLTPQGPGRVKQVHVLRHTVTVQVDGPNETVTLVDVVVPEHGPGEAEPGAGPAAGGRGRSPIASDEVGEPGLVAEDVEDLLEDAVAPVRHTPHAAPPAPRAKGARPAPPAPPPAGEQTPSAPGQSAGRRPRGRRR